MDLSNNKTTQNLEAAFVDLPDDWSCPICGAEKKLFVPYEESAAA